MGRRNRKNIFLENVEILDIASEGKAVARVNDMVVFVTGAIPGDIVNVRVKKKKKAFMEGDAIKLISPSPQREKAFCEYFGTCGGCKWQMLDYKKQLFYKEKQVKDNLERLAKVEIPKINPILPSNQTEFYRNKLEFTFSNRKWITDEQIKSGEQFNRNGVGFHIPGNFDKVVDVEKCHLQQDPSNAIRNEVRKYALENELSFFDIREQHGLLRNLIVRTSSTGEIMVIVAFFTPEKENQEALLNHLEASFPEITSLMYVNNEKKNDSIADQDIKVWKGRDHIFEEMEGLRFKIGPKSFYQTNSEQAYELYKITRDFANLSGTENVYDLYTGTGTIANFVAKKAKHVTGVEYVPEAIEDAHVNAEINNLSNTSFYAGDMKDVFTTELLEKHGKPDVVITDPPRAGMHADVVNRINESGAKKVVYVSCNPATQARDLALMDDYYKVTKVQPVDMFPHTHHVENVVLLEKR